MDRLTRRRLLTGPAALVAGAALAACGQGPAPEGAPPVGGALAPAALDVWLWWKDPVESLQQMGERFAQKVPGSKVTVDAPAGYWDKLTAALAGSAGPDLFFMNNVNYWAWANRGLLVDLDRLVAGDAEMRRNLDASWKDAVTFYKFRGKSYGLPYLYTTVVLYYNTELLKAANLRTPAEAGDAFDWNTARDYAQQLTRREGGEVRTWGIMSTEGIETGWLNFVRANGGDFLDQDHQKCIVDQPVAQEAWQYLVDLRVKDRLSPDAPALQAMSSQNLFINGRLALWPGGSWAMKTLNALPGGLQYDVALLPAAPKTRRRGGTTNIVGVVLNKDGKSRDLSWALLTHFLSKDSQDVIARADVLAPVRNDSAELYYDPKLGPPNRKAALGMQRWTTPLPAHERVSWTEMLAPVTEWQPKILDGSAPVKDGLTQMAAQVNALLGAPR
ncbi:MAG TPA: sugar ABC transporter substrate-binding protein [Chloroflexota bacterium]|nr:sugar ABC transporter substrate-binding protein [Chloroflexota bacterium]